MKFIILLLLFIPMLAQAGNLDNCEGAEGTAGFPSGACELPNEAVAKKDNVTRVDILAQPQATGSSETEASKRSAQNAI